MRQVILVIVLVGAAFLGGAFVNGPGLRWAQTQVLGKLGFSDEVEIASIAMKGPHGNGPVSASSKTAAAKRGGPGFSEPIAPAPTLVADDGKTDAGSKKSKRNNKGATDESGEIAPIMMEPVATSSKTNPQASEKPTDEADLELLPPLGAARPTVPPTDGSVKTAADRGKIDPGPAAPPAPSPDRGPTPALLDSLASFLPPAGSGVSGDAAVEKAKSPGALPLAPTGDQSMPSLPGPGASNGGGKEWTELGRKMRSLGVTRFSVEGEPGGRVVFSCLIPLAGKQAVTQRFEADGDDIFQAVQATLRRIALWKAAQPADQGAEAP